MMLKIDNLPGSVEYRVLSSEQLKEEQRKAIAYVEEMLQLKVSRILRVL